MSDIIITPDSDLTALFAKHGGGKTYIFEDGVYSSFPMPPSDIGTGLTIIKARTDGKAVLPNIRIDRRSDIQIEGFILRHHTVSIMSSDRIILKRLGLKNPCPPNDRYGEAINISDDSSYCLVEDCFIIGSFVYGVIVQRGAHHVTCRRVVTRFDGNAEREPKAGICFYGEIPGDIVGAHDCLAEECIAVDYNGGENLIAGVSMPHGPISNTIRNCITLNSKCAGYYLTQHSPGGGILLEDSVAWNVREAGAVIRDGDPQKMVIVTNLQTNHPMPIGNWSEGGTRPEMLINTSSTPWLPPITWPFLQEERIHALASEPDDFEYPLTNWEGKPFNLVNDTKRGFAADGMTLTRYIHEAIGLPLQEATPGPAPTPEPTFPTVDAQVGPTTSSPQPKRPPLYGVLAYYDYGLNPRWRSPVEWYETLEGAQKLAQNLSYRYPQHLRFIVKVPGE